MFPQQLFLLVQRAFWKTQTDIDESYPRTITGNRTTKLTEYSTQKKLPDKGKQ
jgi:hypothetical protein